jgi:RNA polymerase sigma-70 factor (ECF subfamily)
VEAVRRRAFEVAYRMLGSVAEAEDVAQEAMLRLTRAERPIEEPAAWITTVATRLSVDVLRLARVKRETYIGPWLPEPLVEDAGARVERAETLSQAFLVVLERLTPTERAAFLLREAFDYDYAAIAGVLGHSEASSRQLVTRARQRVEAGRPRFDADEAEGRELLDRFLAATEEGDLEALERLLAEHAVMYADGGGKATAARRPVRGGLRVARALAAIARKQRGAEIELVTVNGRPGRILRAPDRAVLEVLAIDVADGRIQAVRIVRNPDKLRHLDACARNQ